MGPKPSKLSTFPPKTQADEKTVATKANETNELAKISSRKKKRNTYVPYRGQNLPKSGKNKTSVPVEKKTEFTEDSPSKPDYENILYHDSPSKPDYENILYHDGGIETQLPYENINVQQEQRHKKKSGRPIYEGELSIRRHYRELKTRISLLGSICDHLYAGKVLNEREKENIMIDSYPRHVRVDTLLQILLRKKGQKAFKLFCGALRYTGLQDLAALLEDSKGAAPEKTFKHDWSKKDIENVWSEIKDILQEELQPEDILEFFMEENIFSVDEYEKVFWLLGRREEMTKTLLKTMKKHLPKAMIVLLYGLEEVDEENKDIVERLAELIATGNERKDDSMVTDGKLLSNTDAQLRIVEKNRKVFSVPSPRKPLYSLEISVKKDGRVMEKIEVVIDRYMNNAVDDGLHVNFLSQTGCELTGSERGCVIVHLMPRSKHAFEKLCTYCKNGEIYNFVLNLLRQKDICSSLYSGEMHIDIQLRYSEGEYHPKDAEEIEIKIKPDLQQSIKDNWSFLCEELDIDMESLVSYFDKKTIFTTQETTELQRRASKDRHKSTDYFLKCLLKKGTRAIQCFMTALKDKNNEKILKRLQRSDPVYQNPDAVRENMLVHLESIVQEIDPSQFKDTFVDRKILDANFFTNLRKKNPLRRRRAVLFLKEVLNHGNKAICAFVDCMTERNCNEILAKLIPREENRTDGKEERRATDRKEDAMPENTSAPSPETLIWACHLKINVDIKGKAEQMPILLILDETEQQRSDCIEESLYENVQSDEGICRTEDEYENLQLNEDICRTEDEHSKPHRQGVKQKTHRHSEIISSNHPESDLDEYSTYLIDRELTKKKLYRLSMQDADRAYRDSGLGSIEVTFSEY